MDERKHMLQSQQMCVYYRLYCCELNLEITIIERYPNAM